MMEITKTVDVQAEVRIYLSGEEAVAAILNDEIGRDAKQLLLHACSNFAGFIRQVPDSMLGTLTFAQLETMARFFEQQAKRFHAPLEAQVAFEKGEARTTEEAAK